MIRWEHLGESLRDYFPSSGGISYVLCPFINPSTLRRALSHREGQPTIVVTSWRLDHLILGASTLELYPLCQEMGWTLYTNDRLHAKIYSDSLKSAWIGSANLSEKGLGTANEPNLEVLSFQEELSAEARIWIQEIIANSVFVNDRIYYAYVKWMEKQKPPVIDYLEEPELAVEEEAFLISQLPASDSPQKLWELANNQDIEHADWELAAMEHDLAIYGIPSQLELDEFLQKLKTVFFSHPFIETFSKIITDEGIHFGGVKEWIQRNCTDVPVPYRRELTPHVQSLMKWFIDLDPERYEKVVPVYSDVIRRKA